MKVHEIMTEQLASCAPETNLQQVAQMMVDCDCGAIPVVNAGDSNRPVGIVTDRDITIRLVAKGQNPLEKTASDAMTEATVSIHPDADVEEAARLMKQHRIRRLVVVGQDGACVGILSQADLARATSDQLTGDVVEEISETGSEAS